MKSKKIYDIYIYISLSKSSNTRVSININIIIIKKKEFRDDIISVVYYRYII